MGVVFALCLSAPAAWSQDQQVGARTKAMGGSYTAFEDDPISVWLNPAGISTQPDGMALAYQTYPVYEPRLTKNKQFATPAVMGWNDPALIPTFLGVVLQLGESDNPHAVGMSFSTPFRLKFFYTDTFSSPLTGTQDQSFYRFRAAYAHDFHLRAPGSEGFFTHVSVGLGADLTVTHWHLEQFAGDPATLPPPPQSVTFSEVGPGFGAGLLLGLYDNTRDLKVNVGVAYQSGVKYKFSVDPDFVPAFDWPSQGNAGFTFYLLEGAPLRLTTDIQWIAWNHAVSKSQIGTNKDNNFRDVYNYSVGVEYRIPVDRRTQLYPRAGFRYYSSPWRNPDDLPSIGFSTLAIDVKKAKFLIYSGGLGLSWSTENGRSRTVDIAFDYGGEAPGFAMSYTMEF
jgi:long-subunit fatty acid transport protein